MEDDDRFTVPSAPKYEPESAAVDSCPTCTGLSSAMQRIIDMSIEKGDHGGKYGTRGTYTPVCDIGRLSEILTDPNCDRHKAFVRSSFLLRDPEQESPNWGFSKDCEVKVHWDADNDRAILSEESTLKRESYNQEILLLDHGPHPSVSPCLGRPRDEEFISIDLMRQWISSCDTGHKATCSVSTMPSLTLSWLIDTTALCLVPAEHITKYIALSYVWGQTEMLKTTQETLRPLQMEGALSTNSQLRVPPVIRDAIMLSSRLGERYLWIDSLCIMQDDRDSLDLHIRHMASIFEAARFTIVAAGGIDAEHGIEGIEGVSGPRTLPCPVLQLTKRFGLRSRGYQNILYSPWGRRGWTLQEHIFSKRKLVFVHGSVQWICQESRYFEDIRQEYLSNRKKKRQDYNMEQELESVGELALKYPKISEIEEILFRYTERNLTFGDDIIRAVEAIFTAYSEAFPSGFFLGLPVDFFDMALLWRHIDDCGPKRRAANSPEKEPPFPSWTWAGWVGRIGLGTWRAATYIKDADEPLWSGRTCSTIPMLEWRYLSEGSGSERPIPGQNNAYAYKLKYMGKDYGLPPGWKYEHKPVRHVREDNESEDATMQDEIGEEDASEHGIFDREDSAMTTPYYYSHDSAPGVRFWHPVPISTDIQQSRTTPLDGRILCARTQETLLWAIASKRRRLEDDEAGPQADTEDDDPFSEASVGNAILVNIKGEAVGDLWISEEDDLGHVKQHELRPDEAGYPCKLVAISKGNDCLNPMEPGKETFTFYNVLWVKWEAGIAYRRAIGRVYREAWESMELEDIELRLG